MVLNGNKKTAPILEQYTGTEVFKEQWKLLLHGGGHDFSTVAFRLRITV